MKKILSVVASLLLLLSGCMGDTAGKILRYDIAGPVTNLDPQSATDRDARLILANLMEGLVVRTESGGVGPGVARSHDVSDDGLSYTFALRAGAVWRNGEPVTAEDFVFAFRRLFSYPTSLGQSFSAIKNAEEILAGRMGAASLGIEAEDDRTLTFTLAHPDPFFLERLSDPAALPCNEAFFLETKGRYGLEPSSLLTNGPFYLNSWDNASRVQLRLNETYVSARATVAAGVNLHIGRESPEAQFLDGATDVALLNFEEREAFDSSDVTPIQKTVWCMVFNQNHPVWGNPLLRQGLAHAVDHELLGDGLPTGFVPTAVLLPGAVQTMGRSYRETAGNESPVPYDTEEALRLFDMGLAMLGREELPDNSAIVLPELARTSLNISEIQQGWQKYLSAYLNVAVESPAQIEERFRTGDYQILVLPMTPASDDIAALLSAFSSGSRQNYAGYRNALYDGLLETAAAKPTARLAAEEYARAESLLLSDAVVIPLFFETSYLAFQNKTTELVASPFADLLYFKYGRRVE